MMTIVSDLQKVDVEKIKQVFTELLKEYLSPAYGSISKKDFDILLFIKLQELELIEKNPSIYQIVTRLKVTRPKARSLLYESKLRQSNLSDLEVELKEILMSPVFLKEDDKIGIEIDNPYLTDYLRSKLKELNHITDGSFSRELVKLTTDAYASLVGLYVNDEQKKELTRKFIELGLEADKSFTGLIKNVLKVVGSKIAEKSGEKIVESAFEYLEPIFSSNISVLHKMFEGKF